MQQVGQTMPELSAEAEPPDPGGSDNASISSRTRSRTREAGHNRQPSGSPPSQPTNTPTKKTRDTPQTQNSNHGLTPLLALFSPSLLDNVLPPTIYEEDAEDSVTVYSEEEDDILIDAESSTQPKRPTYQLSDQSSNTQSDLSNEDSRSNNTLDRFARAFGGNADEFDRLAALKYAHTELLRPHLEAEYKKSSA